MKIDAVLIDDDSLIRMMWELAAQRAGKSLLTFANPNDFLYRTHEFPKTVPIYCDESLGDSEIRGTQVLRQLNQLGFENLYLSTGYQPKSFVSVPPFVKQILPKDPPW